jgi:hypothetical protein
MIKQWTRGLGSVQDVVPLVEFLVSPGGAPFGGRWIVRDYSAWFGSAIHAALTDGVCELFLPHAGRESDSALPRAYALGCYLPPRPGLILVDFTPPCPG